VRTGALGARGSGPLAWAGSPRRRRRGSSAGHRDHQPRLCLSDMVEPSAHHSDTPDAGPQGRCVCGEKVTIADAQAVILPNGRPGWEGYCPECGAPLFAIRRKRAAG